MEVNSIPVKLDFKPKRVDYAGLRSGRTTEFMNFFVLDGADMVMRHVIIYGVSGFDKMGQTLNDIWMPDIKRNQLPGVLAGLAPIRSLVNVGGGMKDLVVVPMREYRKDGRIVRSIQKGALSFAKTTSNELVKLGAKLAIGTQTVLQGAEDLLTTPAPMVNLEEGQLDEEEAKKISPYADQPIGVVQGLRGAFRGLERDLVLARDAIVAVPGEVVESGSASAAARAVWKRTPTVILRPAIGVSKAVGKTLLGAGNTLDPSNRQKMEDVSLFPGMCCRLDFADVGTEIQTALNVGRMFLVVLRGHGGSYFFLHAHAHITSLTQLSRHNPFFFFFSIIFSICYLFLVSYLGHEITQYITRHKLQHAGR